MCHTFENIHKNKQFILYIIGLVLSFLALFNWLDIVSVYQCVSGEDILVHYGLQNLSHLTEEHLLTVCPALLNQAVLPPCSTEPPVHSDLRGESSCAQLNSKSV